MRVRFAGSRGRSALCPAFNRGEALSQVASGLLVRAADTQEVLSVLHGLRGAMGGGGCRAQRADHGSAARRVVVTTGLGFVEHSFMAALRRQSLERSAQVGGA